MLTEAQVQDLTTPAPKRRFDKKTIAKVSAAVLVTAGLLLVIDDKIRNRKGKVEVSAETEPAS